MKILDWTWIDIIDRNEKERKTDTQPAQIDRETDKEWQREKKKSRRPELYIPEGIPDCLILEASHPAEVGYPANMLNKFISYIYLYFLFLS